MSTQESRRSSPHFSFDYKIVVQQVFLVWNFPPTCKPHKYPILINRFLSITLCAQLRHTLRLPGLVCQAPLSTGFSRQEYWSGVLFLTSEDLPDPGIELESLVSSFCIGRWILYYWATCEVPHLSLSVASNSATLWTAARQASLSITNFRSLLKLLSIESVEMVREPQCSLFP